eukprot:TRINITY_DN92101_c0_g1_i1.p1 TRINITY_DN92101_c0_g1~~TRINITY_DN92101_c0_g1_i1.p1  ORF type:complete len:645 (+),score=185.17 TRINITY_DN92101_c0_g1_i1:28-1962(+)
MLATPLGAWEGGARTSASAAAALAGSGLLQLLVPADCAGRLIGKKGVNIQELQSRTGAKVQLSDLGQDEKLVEVAGPRQCVDDAAVCLVTDLARIQKLYIAGSKLSGLSSQVDLTALVPEDLSDWIEKDLSSEVQHLSDVDAPAAVEEDENIAGDTSEVAAAAAEAIKDAGIAAAPSKLELHGFAEVGGQRFRRLHLSGKPANISQVLRLLSLRLRRCSRWAAAQAKEPAWQLLKEIELDEEKDPEEDFVSTENFFLGLPEGAAGLLSAGAHAELLAQIREDTGAATRVQGAKTSSDEEEPSCLEIAGSFWPKLAALLEMSTLLLQLQPQPHSRLAEQDVQSEVLELWLKSTGPCAFARKEALQLVATASPAVSVTAAGRSIPCRIVLRLAGPRAAICAAALALGRESERKALASERKNGPPTLLVEYLARWFGRDASRLLRERQEGFSKRSQKRSACSDLERPAKRTPVTSEAMNVVEGPALPDGCTDALAAASFVLPCSEAVELVARETAVEEEEESDDEEAVGLLNPLLAPGLDEATGSANVIEANGPKLLLEAYSEEADKDEPEEEEEVEHARSSSEDEEAQPAAPSGMDESQPQVATNEQHAVEEQESDSDSDYYRSGPEEDPLWMRRQAILKKLSAMA